MDLSIKAALDDQLIGDAQVVDHVDGEGVTRGQLRAAFEIVEDRENWKCPIDARVELTEREVKIMPRAIAFFAGCTPEIFPLPGKAAPGKKRYRVMAIGYYAAVGA